MNILILTVTLVNLNSDATSILQSTIYPALSGVLTSSQLRFFILLA